MNYNNIPSLQRPPYAATSPVSPFASLPASSSATDQRVSGTAQPILTEVESLRLQIEGLQFDKMQLEKQNQELRQQFSQANARALLYKNQLEQLGYCVPPLNPSATSAAASIMPMAQAPMPMSTTQCTPLQMHRPVDERLQWSSDPVKVEALAQKIVGDYRKVAMCLNYDPNTKLKGNDPKDKSRQLLQLCKDNNITDLVLIKGLCSAGHINAACDLLTPTTPIEEIKGLTDNALIALRAGQKMKKSQPQQTSLGHLDPMQWFLAQLDNKSGYQSPDEKERIAQQKTEIKKLATQDQTWGNDGNAFRELYIACATHWKTIASYIPPQKEKGLQEAVEASFTANMKAGEQSREFFLELKRRDVTKVELAMALILAGLWSLVSEIQ